LQKNSLCISEAADVRSITEFLTPNQASDGDVDTERAAEMINSQLQRQLARMEELIHELNQTPESPISRQARELVQTLLEFHSAGFEEALELIHDSPNGGQALIDRLAEGLLISNLLVLYNMRPLDLEAHVRNALEKVKPRLGLHGGDVDLVEVLPDGWLGSNSRINQALR
jgi:hypothetical protein